MGASIPKTPPVRPAPPPAPPAPRGVGVVAGAARAIVRCEYCGGYGPIGRCEGCGAPLAPRATRPGATVAFPPSEWLVLR